MLFVPDFSGGNPYQDELAAALERRGTSVSMAISGVSNLPFAAAVRSEGLPDVLHIHWIYPFLIGRYPVVTVLKGTRLLVELIVLKLLGVEVVWTVHNLRDHERRTPRTELLYRHLVARLSDTVLVHCPAAREALVETLSLPDRTRDRIEVVRHGHYIDSYPNDTTAAEARRELDVSPEKRTFLYFGRIRAYKNVCGLVDTFERLDDDDVELLVVGRPGSEELGEAVADRCANDDRVRYVPEFVPEAEVQTYMNAADVVVLPFRDVLSSGSAVLAMSFGNPVIAPNIGCVASLLAEQSELTYDPDADDGLYRALRRAPAADLEAVGARNYRLLRREYDWDDIADRTLRAYGGANAAGRGGPDGIES